MADDAGTTRYPWIEYKSLTARCSRCGAKSQFRPLSEWKMAYGIRPRSLRYWDWYNGFKKQHKGCIDRSRADSDQKE